MFIGVGYSVIVIPLKVFSLDLHTLTHTHTLQNQQVKIIFMKYLSTHFMTVTWRQK